MGRGLPFRSNQGQIQMRTLIILLATAILGAGSVYAQKLPDIFVLVRGGTFKNARCTNYYGKSIVFSNFYIGKFEVTQKEWSEVMGNNPSQFQGDDLPVETVSW